MAEVLPRIRVIDPQARNGSPMTSPTKNLVNGSKDARTTSGDTPEGKANATCSTWRIPRNKLSDKRHLLITHCSARTFKVDETSQQSAPELRIAVEWRNSREQERPAVRN